MKKRKVFNILGILIIISGLVTFGVELNQILNGTENDYAMAIAGALYTIAGIFMIISSKRQSNC